MSSILLLHSEGQDQEALSAYLHKSGHHVSTYTTVHDLASRVGDGAFPADLPVVVLQEQALPDTVDLDFLAGLPVLVLGRRRRLSTRAELVRLEDPYFLNAVLDQVTHLAEYGATPAAIAPAPTNEDTPSTAAGVDQGLVLRGIAHALNNPLSAASGWLQLLEVDLGEGDSRARALNQATRELHRIERLLQAIGLIGGRPSSLRAEIDLQQMVEERTLALEKEGLPVTLQCGGALPRIPGDPSEFGLMLDLLLNSFLEERARVEALDVRIAREGPAVVMTIEEQGGTLPGGCDASDLGLLLRRCRHSRAIGIALANHLVHHRFEGEVKLESGEGNSARFLMRIPVGSQRGADV